jgi:hypothetical protein
MPYLKSSSKQALQLDLDRVTPQSPGELNYCITQLALDYLHTTAAYNYADLNAVIGVMEAAKQEFYRRMVVPYEEQKILENGDVYSARRPIDSTIVITRLIDGSVKLPANNTGDS